VKGEKQHQVEGPVRQRLEMVRVFHEQNGLWLSSAARSGGSPPVLVAEPATLQQSSNKKKLLVGFCALCALLVRQDKSELSIHMKGDESVN
jgi:hypothetical protein